MFKPSGNKKVIAGIDLSDSYLQISYGMINSDTVETISSVTGAEVYNIPMALCKRVGANQWYYGAEAIRCAQEEDAILVENLLSLARKGEMIRIEWEEYDPAALLALFVKRSMGILSMATLPEKLAAVLFTCKQMDAGMTELLKQLAARLELKTDRIFFQSYAESFYDYMLRQPRELWNSKALLLEYREDRMRIYRLECNHKTKPVVVFVYEEEESFMPYEPVPEDDALRGEKYERLDEAFLELAQKALQDYPVSAVYLVGEDFREEWMKESLRFLCKDRRVFQGNNLFSKGACYGMLERIEASEAGKEYVFLGKDKLKSNIGMNILRRGENSYYALLDAGENWQEAEKTLEIYIQNGNSMELMMTSLENGQNTTARIALEELKGGISRLRLHLYLEEEKLLVVEVKDLGFGEFKAAGGKEWKEKIEL